MSIRLPRPSICLGAALVTILLHGALLPTAQAKDKSIIDFTLYHREADGTISKPYEYAWGDWGSRVQNFRDKGTLIVAPSCNGGLGENNTPAEFEGCQTMELTKPSYVEAPGSTPGLNPMRIKVWQVRGDNSAPRIERLLVKLVQAK